MTDPVKEQLSACLDNELAESELDLLLKQVGRDAHLGDSLGRYALIGEALRGQRPVAAPKDFASRVAAALAADTSVTGREAARSRQIFTPSALRWLRPIAGMAVAAGVAAIAVIGLQQSDQAPQTNYVAETSQTQATDLGSDASASYIVPSGTASGSAFVPAARLTNYVVAHSEYSGPLGRRSVLSGVLSDEEGADDQATSEVETDSSAVEPAQRR